MIPQDVPPLPGESAIPLRQIEMAVTPVESFAFALRHILPLGLSSPDRLTMWPNSIQTAVPHPGTRPSPERCCLVVRSPPAFQRRDRPSSRRLRVFVGFRKPDWRQGNVSASREGRCGNGLYWGRNSRKLVSQRDKRKTPELDPPHRPGRSRGDAQRNREAANSPGIAESKPHSRDRAHSFAKKNPGPRSSAWWRMLPLRSRKVLRFRSNGREITRNKVPPSSMQKVRLWPANGKPGRVLRVELGLYSGLAGRIRGLQIRGRDSPNASLPVSGPKPSASGHKLRR